MEGHTALEESGELAWLADTSLQVWAGYVRRASVVQVSTVKTVRS